MPPILHRGPPPPPIMYPRHMGHPPPVSSEQDFLLNILRTMVLPEQDLEILRQMVGKNTAPPISSIAPQVQSYNINTVSSSTKRPRIEE